MDFANKSLQFGSSASELPVTPTEEEKLRAVVGWVPPEQLPRPASHHLKPYKWDIADNIMTSFATPCSRYDQIGWNASLGILSPPTPSPQQEGAGGGGAEGGVQCQPDGAGAGAAEPAGARLLGRMQSLISSGSAAATDTPSFVNEVELQTNLHDV